MDAPGEDGARASGLSLAENGGRWVAVVVVVIAILVAAYTGFRVPNRWCVTLDAVSLFDGFQRRFVVGTLLRPLAQATGYDYWLFAGFSFLVLLALLVVLITIVAREPLVSRRILVIAWLLLPTGGFLFNEVGYFEQVLYLLLFAALWLLSQNRLAFAAGLMCVAPFVHEIAILTVIPVFGLVALRTLPPRRALAVTGPPALLNLIALVIPPASARAIEQLSATLQQANFVPRADALSLFSRTVTESRQMYNEIATFVVVRPAALAVVLTFIAMWLSDRTLRHRGPSAMPASLILLGSCLAIAAPVLLVFGGWDSQRWQFIVISNFFIVMWISLGGRGSREPRAPALIVLATALFLLSHFSMEYFDDYRPRDLGSRPDRRTFLRQVFNHSLFEIPKAY